MSTVTELTEQMMGARKTLNLGSWITNRCFRVKSLLLIFGFLFLSIYGGLYLYYIKASEIPKGSGWHQPIVCGYFDYISLKRQNPTLDLESFHFLLFMKYGKTYKGIWRIFDPILWFDNAMVRPNFWKTHYSSDIAWEYRNVQKTN